jgi:hypothetical protein
MEASWEWSTGIIAANKALAAAIAPDADDKAACAAAVRQLEANLAEQTGTGMAFWLAMFGTLLTPEQALTCFITTWPWPPTLIGIHSGVLLLKRQGKWPE